jgi:hypothetical protein
LQKALLWLYLSLINKDIAMRKIITLDDADIISIDDDDARESYEIIGAQSPDDLVTLETPDGTVIYNANQQANNQFNITASLICSRNIYGEAIFEKGTRL